MKNLTYLLILVCCISCNYRHLRLGLHDYQSTPDIPLTESEKELERRMLVNDSIRDAFFDAIKKKEILTSGDMQMFPWNDVIACKKRGFYFREYENLKTEKCSTCSNMPFWLYFVSPLYTWKELSGRAGKLLICPHCVKQLEFEIELMN